MIFQNITLCGLIVCIETLKGGRVFDLIVTKKKVGGAGHKVMLLMEGKAHAYVFPSPGDIIHIIQAIISSAGDIIHKKTTNARKIVR